MAHHNRTPKIHFRSGTRCCRQPSTQRCGEPCISQNNQPSGARTMPDQANPFTRPKSYQGIRKKFLVSIMKINYVAPS